MMFLRPRLMLMVGLACLLGACAPTAPATPPPTSTVSLNLTVDGQTRTHSLSSTLTVREALNQLGVTLGDLDRVSSPLFTRLSEGLAVRVVRVRETFETEQAVVPFESQTVKNESLPTGETRLLQAGANGVEELTYRVVFEDGVQVSRAVVRRAFVQAPTPEIVMVGAQSTFTIVPVTGTLAYLNAGNAWAMRVNSGQRTLLTTSGDLDGRVFDLSPDGRWLLYTRAVTDSESPLFNTLWAITVGQSVRPLDLGVSNVLYAEWSPVFTQTLAYSTAEKTNRAPGWQANNNLWLLAWQTTTPPQASDFISREVVGVSSGGLYGWWGTGYSLSPDGLSAAFARTDAIGLVDLTSGARQTLTQFVPFNTRSDWAWFPHLSWASGGWLFTVVHGPPLGLELPEDSPAFDVAAVSTALPGRTLILKPQAGMFANPVVAASGRVAYLQASQPSRSAFSRYRVWLMDRDGSNARAIFPPGDQEGVSASATLSWDPAGQWLAVIYNNNLWLVDPASALSQQLTGDGLTQAVDWSR